MDPLLVQQLPFLLSNEVHGIGSFIGLFPWNKIL